ncbi:alpha/beta hydrolase [Candidatus Poribacteria bacterium]|nr:alpha/beta hydrolase [Candidatus Poribacteria bacterium]
MLIPGFEAPDRDGTVFGHHPFLVLADYLTRSGIAVLRVDNRGVGGSTGSTGEATTEDFANDVLAGIAYLQERKEINIKQIGLIGHSEGGLIAPLVATKSADVAFIILMAGPGVIGEEIMYLQNKLVSEASGLNEDLIAINRALMEHIFVTLKEETDNDVAKERIYDGMFDLIDKLPEKQGEMLGGMMAMVNAQLEAQLKGMLSPWFRFFLTYDPKPRLMQVQCPVLAIYGERDLQVPPAQNLPAIKGALEARGNKDYTVTELPNLNHMFQTSETGVPSEYAKIEETIAPVALEAVSDWILKYTMGN